MLFASSPSRITGVGFIRQKESDRLGDLATELHKVGAEIEVEEDGLFIHPLKGRSTCCARDSPRSSFGDGV
jgi:3-phosphoshikimate 1-carboxyvinyltransferase